MRGGVRRYARGPDYPGTPMATSAEQIRPGRLSLAQVLDWLIEDGRLDPELDDLDTVRQLARGGSLRDKHPLETIADRNWPDASTPGKRLTLDRLSQWLAERAGLPHMRIDPLKVDVPAVTAVMSHAYAARFQVLPVAVSRETVTVATAQPWEREWEAEVERLQRKEIRRVVARPDEIRRLLTEFYSMARSVHGAAKDSRPGSSRPGIQSLEQLMELGERGRLDANDQHVVNIVDWLLGYAFDQRASDIHIEPRREHGNVRFRIDGVMHEVYRLPASVLAPVVSRLKIVGRMDVAEKRKPQDGRLKTRTPEGQEVELRLSTMPTAHGEKLVMRIFDPDVLLKDFKDLGFSRDDAERWTAMVDEPHGLVLVTGPTGSGKTTTLYSTLKQLARPDVNVCSVEDPIELVEDAFNQMQVQPSIGLDFASGIRTLMRQDPDIIMVGEIRDRETADMALQAALTGHLVLATLHTNDAPSAVTRLQDLGVPAYLIHTATIGIMAQRLLRTLCPHCRQPHELSDAAWAELVKPFDLPKPEQVNRAVGCLECRNTGYRGRAGIYELLSFTPEVQALVAEGAEASAIRKQGMRDGMKLLRLRGAQKVAEGVTTPEEVLRVVPPAE